MKKAIILIIALGITLSGCSSTSKRAGIITLGTAAGAGVGYAAADEKHKAVGTAAGAVAGAGVTALVLGPDKEQYALGLNDGYTLASGDAIKRLYWAKAELEAGQAGNTAGGRLNYYIWEEQGTTQDGRRLAPERMAVPIYEPMPK